jgi:hypothetical protein
VIGTAHCRELYYGYFDSTNASIRECADHVNLAFIDAAGPSDSNGKREVINKRILDQMGIAQNQGTKTLVIGLKHLLYDTKDIHHSKFLGDAEALSNLRYFFLQMWEKNLTHLVRAWYPIDEPDGKGLSDGEVKRANWAIRRAASNYSSLSKASIAACYSNIGWPGFDSYDWVGFDDYKLGNAIFSPGGRYHEMVSKLKKDQKTLIVPGGAEPFKLNPEVFLKKALDDARIIWLMPFLWIRYEINGQNLRGIGENDMKSHYVAAGKKIKHKSLN